MDRLPDEQVENLKTVAKGVGCVGAVGGGLGCVTALVGAATLACAGVGVSAYNVLSDDSNTAEMEVTPAVKYAPGAVLNCRENPVAGSKVVETYEPGETVTVDLDRPAQGDWNFTTDNCWVAEQLAGKTYLTPIAE